MCPSDWTPPDVPRLTLPRFPVSALPEWHGDFVIALAEQAQVAPELPALLSCAAIGSASAKRVVLVDGSERHPLHLWALVPMETGEGKTPIVNEIAFPFRSAQDELRARAADQGLEGAVERDLLQRRRSRVARTLDGLELRNDGDAAERAAQIPILRAELRGIHEALDKLRDQPPPTIVMEDTTPAAFAVTLANQRGTATVISDEGTSLFRSFFAPAALADPVEMLLKAYSGSDIEEARVGRGMNTIRNPAVGLLLATQPQAIRRLLQLGAFGRRGFLERFLYLLPPSRVGARRNVGSPLDPWVRNQYGGLVRSLLELPINDRRPRELRLAREAKHAFDEFCSEVDQRISVGDLVEPPLSGWANKVRESTIRLAGVLHISSVLGVPFDDTTAPQNVVSSETMEHTISIMRVCIEHARHLLVGFAQGRDDADILVNWLRRRRVETLSVRDLRRSLSTTFPTAEKLSEVLHELEGLNVVRLRTEHGELGRPSPQVDVNPLLWAVGLTPEHAALGDRTAEMPKVDDDEELSAFWHRTERS